VPEAGQPLRVCVITPDFPPARGGIQHLVHRLVEQLEGVEAAVVTFDQPGSAEFDRAQPFAVRRVRAGGSRAVAVARLNRRAALFALRFRPDVVLSGHIVVSPAAAFAKKILRVPVVQYLYALEIGARPRLAGFALRNADRSIAISAHTKELALSAGGKADNVRQIPPGVDLPGRIGGDRAERPTVLTVAQLESRYKGFDVMVRALPLVRAKVPDVEWVLVGDGPLRAEIERLLVAQRLDGVARFVGELSDDERDRWLERAHVFAMPSRLLPGDLGGEGFGIAYLEAGAHGLPVVAGNAGGTLDAVVDGRTGLLVDPFDHVAVAGAICELLGDARRAAELGRAGAERAREFAWPRIAKEVRGVLAEVAR
jgi:phosphatidylinositol alpha-1,6-mannosyltransferase